MDDKNFESGISQVEAVFNTFYTAKQKLVYFQCLNEAPNEVWVKAVQKVIGSFQQYGTQKLPLPVHFAEAIKELSPPRPEHAVPMEERLRWEQERLNKQKGTPQ